MTADQIHKNNAEQLHSLPEEYRTVLRRLFSLQREMMEKTRKNPNYDETPEGEKLSREMARIQSYLDEHFPDDWESKMDGDACEEIKIRYAEVRGLFGENTSGLSIIQNDLDDSDGSFRNAIRTMEAELAAD